jgi:hypothetical protein
MELTPKQQTSEAIRQADTILIATGQHPSIDQVAAVVSLSQVLRKVGKKVTAIVSDNIPAQVNFLPLTEIDKSLSGLRDFVLKVDLRKAEVDKLKYTIEDGKLNVYVTPFKGGFTPGDVTYAYGNYHYDLIIVLGVPTRTRIDRVFEQNPQLFTSVPVINMDFHRGNENYGAINLVDSNAASLCELLLGLAESLQTGVVDETIATSMLTGIISSTDRYTATHTTAKSLTVAAQLMAAGAKHQTIVKNLYKSDNRSSRPSDGDRSDSPRTQQPTPKAAPVQEMAVEQVQAVEEPRTDTADEQTGIESIVPDAQEILAGQEPNPSPLSSLGN